MQLDDGPQDRDPAGPAGVQKQVPAHGNTRFEGTGVGHIVWVPICA